MMVASAALLGAQAMPVKMDLSLKRAAEIALAADGNVRIALAEQSVEQAVAREKQARAGFFPSIDGTSSGRNQTNDLKTFGFSFGAAALGFSIPTFVGPFTVFDARVQANQSVLDLTIFRKFRAAQANTRAAKLDSETARTQVTDQVARAYLACVRADEALDSARSDVDLSEALVKLALSQKDAGTGTGIEVTRAQVQLSNDRTRLTLALNERTRTALNLMRTIGLSMEADLNFTDKLTLVPVTEGALAAAVNGAKIARAELKAQRQKEEAAKLNYGAVRAERLPSIGAFGDYGSTGPAMNDSRATRDVGVSLKIPLYDGGRRGGRYTESLSQYEQEKLRTKDLERQVELEVRVAFDNLNSARTQVATANDGLQLAENELAQARRRYEAGVTNSIEVTDAQTRLARARDNRVSALYNYNLARLDLATATGSIVEFVNQ